MKSDLKKKSDWGMKLKYLLPIKKIRVSLKCTKTPKIATLPDYLSNTVQMHYTQFWFKNNFHFKIHQDLAEVNEKGRQPRKRRLRGREQSYSEMIETMSSLDYKSIKLYNYIMSTQTQTGEHFSQGKASNDEKKKRNLSNWHM